MLAGITDGRGRSPESSQQRRVDRAIAFAVWACELGHMPCQSAVMDRFDVSRATATRLRRSLSRAIEAARLRAPRAEPLRPKSSATAIAAELTANREMLALSVATIVRTIRSRYGCTDGTARKALRLALATVADVSRGTTPA